MDINCFLDKGQIRKNYNVFNAEFSGSLFASRYSLIFGKLASVQTYDLSDAEKKDADAYAAIELYCKNNGYEVLQKFDLENLPKKDKNSINSGVLYIHYKKEVLLYFHGSCAFFVYDSRKPAGLYEFDCFFKVFVRELFSIPEKKKSLFFIDSSNSTFSLKAVPFENGEKFDAAKFYNDDFQAVSSKIEKFIAGNKSGLVILHGRQGTGKTSFMRHLINISDKKFVYVPFDIVSELDTSAELIKNCLKDNVIIIEDCDRLLEDRSPNFGKISRGLSILLNITDGLLGDVMHTKVICTFNSGVREIDQSLLRRGRLVEKYEFRPLSKEKTEALFKELYPGESFEPQELTIAEILNRAGVDSVSPDGRIKKKVGF